MGTWGSGNLDSDGTLDVLGEQSQQLIDRMWAALKDTTSAEADESDHDQLFVDLEWILTLEDANRFSGWHLPTVAELDAAITTWVAHWSGYFDGLSGPEFKAERLGVIEATFARLRTACAKYEARRAG